MAGCSDNEQFDFKLFGKFDDVSHRMPGDNMRIEFDTTFIGHSTCALQDLVKPPRGRPGLLANLFDEFRHIVDLFYGNHMKLGVVLLCQRERQPECVKGVLRPVIGVQNLAEH